MQVEGGEKAVSHESLTHESEHACARASVCACMHACVCVQVPLPAPHPTVPFHSFSTLPYPLLLKALFLSSSYPRSQR